ncbi:MAG: NAD(P)-binding domain-containing protein [Vampirovibrio sp.]|nr:NAD(P)-binding domain-containing protein [Vampirovibrio sp.]
MQPTLPVGTSLRPEHILSLAFHNAQQAKPTDFADTFIKPDEPLSAMETVFNYADRRKFQFDDKTVLMGSQHLMMQTVVLCKALIKLGMKADNIFLTGRSYSSHPTAIKVLKQMGVHVIEPSTPTKIGGLQEAIAQDAQELFSEVNHHIRQHQIKKLIVVDKGASLWPAVSGSIPANVKTVGVAHNVKSVMGATQNGWTKPVVEMGTSAAKFKFESFLIAADIMALLENHLGGPLENKQCGIIGYGHIGKALAQLLVQKNNTVTVYDKDRTQYAEGTPVSGVQYAKSIPELMNSTSYVFTATGADVFQDTLFPMPSKKTTLINTTSGDLTSLLKQLGNQPQTRVNFNGDIITPLSRNNRLRILRNGQPINFDNSLQSTPLKEIQLTVALALASCVQAGMIVNLPNETLKAKGVTLDSNLQQKIVNAWIDDRKSSKRPPLPAELVRSAKDVAFFF